MPDILHKLGIRADIHKVFNHLSTINGLSKWWTREVAGGTTKGNTIRFSFGADNISMEVREAVEPNLMKWMCVQGPDEWLHTDITFELSQSDENETTILFTHAHWQKPSEFMHLCSTKWAVYLLSLKSCIEENKGAPYPDDIKITND